MPKSVTLLRADLSRMEQAAVGGTCTRGYTQLVGKSAGRSSGREIEVWMDTK